MNKANKTNKPNKEEPTTTERIIVICLCLSIMLLLYTFLFGLNNGLNTGLTYNDIRPLQSPGF